MPFADSSVDLNLNWLKLKWKTVFCWRKFELFANDKSLSNNTMPSSYTERLHSCEKKSVYYRRLHPMPQYERQNGWMSLTNFLFNWFELLNCEQKIVCPCKFVPFIRLSDPNDKPRNVWNLSSMHSSNKIVAPKHWNQGVYNLINCLRVASARISVFEAETFRLRRNTIYLPWK